MQVPITVLLKPTHSKPTWHSLECEQDAPVSPYAWQVEVAVTHT